MRRSPALLAALVVFLLAGCASIPVSGPVQTSVPQREQDGPVVYVPSGPTDGMSAEDVVRGFVRAQEAGGDYAVAKEFLTASFATKWDPDESVLVHAAPWSVEDRSAAGDRVRLRVPVVAEVDSTGHYALASGSPTKDYGLQHVRGQWRISSGPDGVVVSQQLFPQLFQHVSLQFFDPSYRRLVPDLRWFPVADDTAAQVVRALIGGASAVLQGVIAPVFPSGTEQAAPVRSSGGVVTVSVRVPGSAPTVQETDRIQQAVAASLVKSTALLRLVVNGRTAPVASAANLEQPSISGAAVVAGGRFGTLTSQGTLQEDEDLGPRIVAAKPTAITVFARGRLAAVLDDRGRVEVVTRQRARVVDARSGLIAPTLDQQGWTYSVPGDDPTGLQVADAAGHVSPVQADLDVTRVASIEVSTDGTRLLVLGDSDSGPLAYVAGIVRDADGRPIGLTADQDLIAVGSTTAIDATWVDQGDVAVLTGTTSTQSVTLQQVGGIAAGLGSLSNAKTLVGATAPSDLRALLGTGQILLRTSSNVWNLEFPAALRVAVLAVQR